MKWLLDTNVVSENVQRRPNQAVVDWIAQRPPDQVAISIVTMAELWVGAQASANPERRTLMLRIGVELVLEDGSGLPRSAAGKTSLVRADRVPVAGAPACAPSRRRFWPRARAWLATIAESLDQANLFSHLRVLDAAGVAAIAVMPVPHAGLGRAQ